MQLFICVLYLISNVFTQNLPNITYEYIHIHSYSLDKVNHKANNGWLLHSFNSFSGKPPIYIMYRQKAIIITENIDKKMKIEQDTNISVLNISKKLKNKMIKYKNNFQKNFNKIIYNIDHIINNVPDEIISEQLQIHEASYIEYIYNSNAKGPIGIKCKIKKLSSIVFRSYLHNNNCIIDEIIIIYEIKNYTEQHKKHIYSRYQNKLNITNMNSQLFINKLNEYGFKTVMIGFSSADGNFGTKRFYCGSFAIIF